MKNLKGVEYECSLEGCDKPQKEGLYFCSEECQEEYRRIHFENHGEASKDGIERLQNYCKTMARKLRAREAVGIFKQQ